MKETRIIMGMPITIEVRDVIDINLLETVFDYFLAVDQRFSTYKDDSEITLINKNILTPKEYSSDMREVLDLADQTRQESEDYFDIRTPAGTLDPSGLVKGWAIFKAAQLLQTGGSQHFFIDAGGDIQTCTPDNSTEPWLIGIQNPFNNQEVIKVVELAQEGMATSGNYLRGAHIYNPKHPNRALDEVVSITVIGPNIYEADRFATAAFAMGTNGVYFIEKMDGLEAYQINAHGIATQTTGFSNYIHT